ncbi:MAG: response regulator, partial [Dehalococcoidia bacterium]
MLGSLDAATSGDDDPGFGKLVRRVAEQMGYDVKVVTRSREFPEAYKTMCPTDILVDVVMPDVDGIELMKWLAQEGCDARLTVITGYSTDYAKMTEKIGRASGLNLATSLTKPMTIEDLRNALAG